MAANDPTRANSSRKVLLVLLAITLVKMALFGLLVQIGRASPFEGDNAVDHYIPIAERLLTEGRFNGPETRLDSKVPPGYPLFLAGIKAVTGTQFLVAAVLAQFLVDFFTACVLYLLASEIASRWVGFWAGLAWVLYPPELVMATWISAETLFTLLLSISFLLLWLSVRRDRVALACWAGLALGAATLVRGTCLYFPLLFLVVWTIWRGRRGFIKGICFGAATACVILPWLIRNEMVLGDPIPVSVGAGSAFLQGSDEAYFTIEGKRANYPQMYINAEAAGVVKPTSERESDIDRWLVQVGLYNYRVRLHERPLSYVPFLLHKAVRMWYGTETGGVKTQLMLGVCSLGLLPLAGWQLLRWWGSQRDTALLFGCMVVYFFLLHWATLPQYRYVHPIYPLFILAACQAVFGTSARAVKATIQLA